MYSKLDEYDKCTKCTTDKRWHVHPKPLTTQWYMRWSREVSSTNSKGTGCGCIYIDSAYKNGLAYLLESLEIGCEI